MDFDKVERIILSFIIIFGAATAISQLLIWLKWIN